MTSLRQALDDYLRILQTQENKDKQDSKSLNPNKQRKREKQRGDKK